MRKLFVLLVLVFIFGTFFTSCSSGNGPVDMNFIQGKWNFNKSSATTSGITLPYSTDYFNNEVGCNKDYIELDAGGIAKYGNYTTSCAFEEKIGNWSQSGNTISIFVTGTNLSGTFRVASLSASDLVLKFDGTYSGISGTFNLYFNK
jgi:hypothetical protein